MKTIQQRGFALAPFLIGALLLVLAVIVGLQMIPAYIQSSKITSVFNAIKHDPEMAQANLDQMRASFARRSSVDSITAITPEQIKLSDKGELIAHYETTIPLVGNVSLLLEFNPRSAQ